MSTARPLPHIYLPNHGHVQDYKAHKGGGGDDELPKRDRAAHAAQLANVLMKAVQSGEALLAQRDDLLAGGTPGFYLEFELPQSRANYVEHLENRKGNFPIELVSVKPLIGNAGEEDKVTATVFVPKKQRDFYLKKVEEYRTKDRAPKKDGKVGPKNEALIASIDTVRLAAARCFYTDAPNLFPENGKTIWWEVWLRSGSRSVFDVAAAHLSLEKREHGLTFLDREVVLVCATSEELEQIIANTNSIAELRLARDTPHVFMCMDSTEQKSWSAELAQRVIPPSANAPAVCLLDSGTTFRHKLIQIALNQVDQQAYDAGWSVEDTRARELGGHGGHGTEMSGLVLYGDLQTALNGSSSLELTHRLESVKILPDVGENEPRLYGVITSQAIARAEIVAPHRSRVICLAVTSPGDHGRGRPSSWSAALDSLAFGADSNIQRLIVVAAGNIREKLVPQDYLHRNDASPIENPAQAWNALTVGAFTENITISNPSYQDWRPLAPIGDLMPHSRTSVSWSPHWPLKPDVVFEGGNLSVDPDNGVWSMDDLSLLTTFRRPEERQFTITADTSAATALAARMAAQILAKKPQIWPETVRALIVHSATWTKAMQAHRSNLHVKTLLRRYGFGVPSLDRALQSLSNDVTMIVEKSLQPFKVEKDSKILTIKLKDALAAEGVLGVALPHGTHFIMFERIDGRNKISVTPLDADSKPLQKKSPFHVVERNSPGTGSFKKISERMRKNRRQDMVLHELPWPKKELAAYGETEVELRVTLSYFIEPNPSERGYVKRYSYASHGLCFAVKRGDEPLETFCRRVNADAGERPHYQEDPGWLLGPQLRYHGSLHADIWKGTAVDLSERHAIAVYPSNGWWREREQRWNSKARYSLIVSLRTAEGVDIYTPIRVQTTPEISIDT